jgi:arylsulfatase
MKHHPCLRTVTTFAVTAFLGLVDFSPLLAQASADTPPNILLILVDDLGFSDLGCYGSEIQTPNLDSLAQRGIRFANFYNHAKCNPTRSSIPRGAYAQQPPQSGISNVLAQRLKDSGYATLFVGKNHSGEADGAYRMRYSMNGGAENHFNPGFQRTGETQVPAHGVNDIAPDCDWRIDNVLVDVTGGTYEFPANHYSTVTFTDKAIQYLDTQVGADEPFFLYLSLTAPHFPLQALPADKAAYAGVYEVGWDVIRTRRFARQKKLGLFGDTVSLSPIIPDQYSNWPGCR